MAHTQSRYIGGDIIWKKYIFMWIDDVLTRNHPVTLHHIQQAIGCNRNFAALALGMYAGSSNRLNTIVGVHIGKSCIYPTANFMPQYPQKERNRARKLIKYDPLSAREQKD
jgi:hypothetical protein